MTRGHIATLAGGALVLLGGTALEWQRFGLAAVSAHGFEVPVVAQVILLLALIVCAAASIGVWRERLARRAAVVTLTGAIFLLGWMAYAAGSAGGALATMPHETLTLGVGFHVALAGAVLALIGALAALAAEPSWDPSRRMLRVALVWDGTVVAEKVMHTPRDVRVGPRSGDDFIVGGVDESLLLFEASDDGSYALHLDGAAGGQLTRAGRSESVSALRDGGADDVAVDEGDWGFIDVGAAQVFFQFIRPEPGGTPSRRAVAVDEHFATTLGGSFFAQVAVVVVAVLLWDAESTRALVDEARMDAQIEASVTMLEEPDELALSEEGDVDRQEDTSKAAEGPEGTFGVQDAPAPKTIVPRIDEGRQVTEVDPHRVALTDLLTNDKLMGPGTALSEVFSQTGADMEEKLAVLTSSSSGSELALGPGTGGLSFTGGDTGGGGKDGTGRIHGVDDIDTGPGRQIGVRTALGPKEARKVPRVTDRVGTSSEFCRPADIRSKVARRLGAVKGCYEQRLAVKKGLRGKLTLRWTIGLDGHVAATSVDGDTVGDQEVANCVLRTIRRIRFEEPNGGMCVVRWPFVFDVE